MLGMFCGSKSTTNEEYKKYIKARIKIFIVLILLGVITLFISILGDKYLGLKIKEEMISTYGGLGTGLLVMGVILLIKNISILKDEEKLRKIRIQNTDERNNEISIKASRVALTVMLVTMYLAALVGGLWYPELTQVLFFIISLFLISYVIAYKSISRKI